MKRLRSILPALCLLASGCAVASIDESMQEQEQDDINPDPVTGGTTGWQGSTGGVPQQGPGPTPATGGSGSSGAGGSDSMTGGQTSTGGNTAAGGSDASGGNAATGGSDSTDPPPDPSGCTALGHNEDSGEFGTTDPKCFIVDYTGVMYGWRASNSAGRSVTINGEIVGQGDISSGPVPWPGSSPYLVEFSAGSQANTTWAYW